MTASPADFYNQVRAMLAGSRGGTPRKRRRRQAAKIFDLDPLPFFTAGDDDGGSNRQGNGIDPIGGGGADERVNPQIYAQSFYDTFANRHVEPHWKGSIDSSGDLSTVLVWNSSQRMLLNAGTLLTSPKCYAYLTTERCRFGFANIYPSALPSDESAIHVFFNATINASGDLSGWSHSYDFLEFALWRWDNGTKTKVDALVLTTGIDWIGIGRNGANVTATYYPTGGPSSVAWHSAAHAEYNASGAVGVCAEFWGAGISAFVFVNTDG